MSDTITEKDWQLVFRSLADTQLVVTEWDAILNHPNRKNKSIGQRRWMFGFRGARRMITGEEARLLKEQFESPYKKDERRVVHPKLYYREATSLGTIIRPVTVPDIIKNVSSKRYKPNIRRSKNAKGSVQKRNNPPLMTFRDVVEGWKMRIHDLEYDHWLAQNGNDPEALKDSHGRLPFKVYRPASKQFQLTMESLLSWDHCDAILSNLPKTDPSLAFFHGYCNTIQVAWNALAKQYEPKNEH